MTHTDTQYLGKFASLMKSARQRLGFSQEELAGIVGLTRVHIANLESGKYHPSFQTAIRIAALTGISLDQIVVIARPGIEASVAALKLRIEKISAARAHHKKLLAENIQAIKRDKP